jgi:pyruvate/2-oxoglutarate dehydrogenase complex dihydrolipoamide acyltransferase (E2) component
MEVVMPKLGLTMEEGTVIEWLTPDGTHVVVDQPVCEIETDKATQQILAEADGVLRHAVPVDTTVPAGAVIAHID